MLNMLILKFGLSVVWLIYPTNILQNAYSVIVIVDIMVNKKDMARPCKEIAC